MQIHISHFALSIMTKQINIRKFPKFCFHLWTRSTTPILYFLKTCFRVNRLLFYGVLHVVTENYKISKRRLFIYLNIYQKVDITHSDSNISMRPQFLNWWGLILLWFRDNRPAFVIMTCVAKVTIGIANFLENPMIKINFLNPAPCLYTACRLCVLFNNIGLLLVCF